MKLYQIILLTFSTVSIIHCSQQSNEKEHNNAAYHIEFEDKSIHGGYGYKLQVAGKQKYQESWKNDHTTSPTVPSTASGTLDYAHNNYAGLAEENNYAQDSLSSSVGITNSDNSFDSEKTDSSFAPSSRKQKYQESWKNYHPASPLVAPTASGTYTQQQENNFALDSAGITSSDNSFDSGNQYSSDSSFGPSSGEQKYQESWKNYRPTSPIVAPTASGTFTQQQENNFAQDSLSNSAGITSSDNSFDSENQYSSDSSYAPSSDNIFYKNKQSSSFLNDQSQPSYSTINNFNSYSQYVSIPKPSLSSQNSFTSHNYESSNQDSQPKYATFSQYSNKPSVQIMGTDFHKHTGPQVFVESIYGKLNHSPYSHQVDSKPQINFGVNHGYSSNYLKNAFQHSVKNPVSYHADIPAKSYHQKSQSYYKPAVEATAYKSQYESQLLSAVAPQQNNYEEINPNENVYYSPMKYSTQFASPVSSQLANQYGYTHDTPNFKENFVEKLPVVQYSSQISSVPSTQFIKEQKIKHSKGNTLHKSVSSSYKYAPQHQTEQYIPMQDSNSYQGLETILHKPSVNQYSSHISSNPSSEQGSFGNVHYNQLSDNYAAEVPSTEFNNQEITKYVSHQPAPSVQFTPSVQLPTDYSQFIQQHPQESLSSEESDTEEIPQQHLYNTNQPTANKHVVSYHYKQEFPATTSNSYTSPNVLNSQQAQPISQSPYGLEGPSYNNLLSGYNAQSMFRPVANNIPVSSSQTYGNVETQKDQILYAPGLAYGYRSQFGNGQGLLSMNGFNNVVSNAYLNGLQFKRRSSGEADRKQYEVDQKQTE